MTVKIFRSLRVVLPALLTMGVTAGAQAANYVTLSGVNVDFLVDADYFDLGGVMVTGNAIAFNFAPDRYVTSVENTRPSRPGDSTFYGSTATRGLLVIAHQGYDLGSSFTSNATANYVRSANADNGGNVYISSKGYIGSYAGGVFSGDTVSDSSSFINFSYSKANITYYSNFSSSTTATNALALDVGFNASLWVSGLGSASAGATSLTYQFTAVADGSPLPPPGSLVPPVSNVPEPETYAMLLAGLGLLGLVRRRK